MATAPKEKVYVWQAKDKKGRSMTGEMKAESESVVRVALRSRNLLDIKVKKQSFKRGSKIAQADVAIFTRQLATMMKSGVPMIQSFEIVANGHSNPAVSK